MSHQTIDIIFNVTGQSLYFDAPEGRASSVTSSTVYENTQGDDGTTESALTGSAAVETNPNTTFDADSGFSQADSNVANLTATTGCAVGRVYLATNALGEKEFGEVTGVSSGAFVRLREPLKNDYANADTFVSTRITHAFDSTWIAEKNNISADFDPNPRYRWRLVYVVASVTYVHDLYFDLLRYPARYDTSPVDVDRKFPGWMSKVATYYREDQGRSLIEEAFREVKYDLYNELKPDQSIRNREVVNELVALRAGVFTNEPNALERYRSRFDQLIHWTKVPFSVDSGAGATRVSPLPLWRR